LLYINDKMKISDPDPRVRSPRHPRGTECVKTARELGGKEEGVLAFGFFNGDFCSQFA